MKYWYRRKKEAKPKKQWFEVTHYSHHLILYRRLNGLMYSQCPYMDKIVQSGRLYAAIRRAMEMKEDTRIDNFVHSITFRAEVLNRGFYTLFQNGNYLCAAPLIRMQADNILTCLAGLACNDREKFYRVYNEEPEASGAIKKLNQLKDSKGNQLTSKFLTEIYAKGDPLFREVFTEGNKYIHPSKVFQDASKGYKPYREYKCSPEEIKNFEGAMIYVNNILANVLVRWILLKHRIDVGIEFATPELVNFASKMMKEEKKIAEIPEDELPQSS